jgi:hypothetical protein
MTMILDGSNGVTFNDSSLQGAAASPYVLKNRIINGDMRIDQRNAGAILTVTSSGQKYPVDRFYSENPTDGTFTVQQSSTAPAGFNNSYVATVTATDTNLTTTQFAAIAQQIEGYNIADFGWGTANAKTVTLSFWVQSSVTGAFGGSFRNSADNRCYPFSYTINSANTWEQKTITVAGDTTGTWLTTNGIGLKVWFSLGAGPTYSGTANSWQSTLLIQPTGSTNLLATNGATFYLTGVQLEIGSTATPFERRLYNQELANCYRYFRNYNQQGTMYGIGANNSSTTIYRWGFTMDVAMRAGPTITFNSMAGWSANGGVGGNISVSSNTSSINNVECDLNYSSGSATQGIIVKAHANTASSFFTVSAEL